METSVSFPLDNDGFLRGECPTYEREFKWLPSGAGDGSTDSNDAVEPGGYHCPYCGVQADAENWLTRPQVALVHHIARREFVDPLLRDFGSSLERQSSEHVTFKANPSFGDANAEPELSEGDDMKRVDFACHQAEPVKVADDWTGRRAA
ncbi:MAG: hypothetical protein ACJ757_10320 [Gaiellaceae bacterium]